MLSAQRSMNVRGHRRSTSKAVSAAAAFEVVGLERRLLMCLDGSGHDDGGLDELPSDLGTYPAIHEQATVTASGATGSATPAAAGVALSSVPALSSHPTAYAKLYLDFNGDTTNTWGSYSPSTTPAYDTDGDPTTFSDAELASMREIFNRVAEKYSPLNVDVTTVDPGNLNNGQTEKVVIGGGGAWLGGQAGGGAVGARPTHNAPRHSFLFFLKSTSRVTVHFC